MKKFYKQFGKRSRLPGRAAAQYCTAVLEDRDHMPVEIATSLLLEPKAQLTMTLRKACLVAREKHYVPTAEPKPHSDKLAKRAREAKWAQLCKWLPRVQHKLLAVEKQEKRIKGMGEKEQKLRQYLMLRENLLEGVQAILKEEMQKRIAA
jgi:hypothetical protein